MIQLRWNGPQSVCPRSHPVIRLIAQICCDAAAFNTPAAYTCRHSEPRRVLQSPRFSRSAMARRVYPSTPSLRIRESTRCSERLGSTCFRFESVHAHHSNQQNSTVRGSTPNTGQLLNLPAQTRVVQYRAPNPTDLVEPSRFSGCRRGGSRTSVRCTADPTSQSEPR